MLRSKKASSSTTWSIRLGSAVPSPHSRRPSGLSPPARRSRQASRSNETPSPQPQSSREARQHSSDGSSSHFRHGCPASHREHVTAVLPPPAWLRSSGFSGRAFRPRHHLEQPAKLPCPALLRRSVHTKVPLRAAGEPRKSKVPLRSLLRQANTRRPRVHTPDTTSAPQRPFALKVATGVPSSRSTWDSASTKIENRPPRNHKGTQTQLLLPFRPPAWWMALLEPRVPNHRRLQAQESTAHCKRALRRPPCNWYRTSFHSKLLRLCCPQNKGVGLASNGSISSLFGGVRMPTPSSTCVGLARTSFLSRSAHARSSSQPRAPWPVSLLLLPEMSCSFTLRTTPQSARSAYPSLVQSPRLPEAIFN